MVDAVAIPASRMRMLNYLNNDRGVSLSYVLVGWVEATEEQRAATAA